ncbi:MAG: S9 family peptidase, partial [Flavobacteriaceae bacterium]|nr:S9 family peptidase [Flavobacteriaceae bacterium]
MGCSTEETKKESMTYPETRMDEITDTYFDREVNDPYRWLEDDRSEETEAWVKAQNEVTFGYLKQIPYRKSLEERLTEIWNYEKVGAPFVRGDYTYFYKNDGLQNQSVMYRYKTGENPDEAEVFLDPNTFSEGGTTSLAGASFTEDGKILAYSISEGGSDWRKIILLNTETKEQIEDTLVDVKFSGVSWYKNEGFYYSSYDKPEGSELSAKTDQHKLYYHKLGTPQSEDQVIFGATEEEKHRYVGGYVTEDDKYLVISASVATSGNRLFIKDLETDGDLISVIDHYDNDVSVIENEGTKLFMVTNLDAPNKRVVTVDAKNPTPEHWEDFIPETENVLSPSTAGGYFFASYMVDAITQVKQYDYEGNLVREIDLPGVGTASGFGAKKDEDH